MTDAKTIDVKFKWAMQTLLCRARANKKPFRGGSANHLNVERPREGSTASEIHGTVAKKFLF